jgi:hypothetical protein
MTISLDGFVADQNGNARRLAAFRHTTYMNDAIEQTGAVLMGRKTFERYRAPTRTRGLIHIRALQVISPRRIPSRSRLVNTMKRVYVQRCSRPRLQECRPNPREPKSVPDTGAAAPPRRGILRRPPDRSTTPHCREMFQPRYVSWAPMETYCPGSQKLAPLRSIATPPRPRNARSGTR